MGKVIDMFEESIEVIQISTETVTIEVFETVITEFQTMMTANLKSSSIQELALRIVQYSLMTITGLTTEKITSFVTFTEEISVTIVSVNLELASVTEQLVKVAGEAVAH